MAGGAINSGIKSRHSGNRVAHISPARETQYTVEAIRVHDHD